ncbi:MAG: MFS transporter [Candidatus Sericytochromatia bacterium]|nr:MFS transporter [Candidatus Sericytochromatia bacterium]
MARSPLAILFITVFLDLLGFGLILPQLPYYAVRFGAGALAVGGLMAAYSLAQMVASPLWGGVSDRVGRRPVLIGSLVGSAASTALLGAVVDPAWWARIGGGLPDTLLGASTALLALFAARVFAGTATATIGVAQAYIADSTTPETRAKGMGIIGAAFGLGFVFGPALGGLLAPFGPGVPALVAAGLALANAAFAWVRLPESLPAARRGVAVARGFSVARLRQAAIIPGMAPLMAMYFLSIFAFATMEATFPLLTRDAFGFGEVQNGWTFAYIGVLVVIMQGGLVGRLAKRFGERRLVVAGGALLAVGLAGLPLSPSVAAMAAVLVPLCAGSGLTNPSLTALISLTAAQDAQGETLGTAQSLASLGRVLGPLWGGFAFGALGATGSYAVAAGVMLTVAGMMWATSPRPEDGQPASSGDAG